jgi:hypothetical protein
LVGGLFSSYSGTSSNCIIRLNANGSMDNTFNIGTGFDSVVWDIDSQSDGKVFVAGEFTSYNGTTSNGIIKLNSNGSIDNTLSIGTGFNDVVYNILFLNSQITTPTPTPTLNTPTPTPTPSSTPLPYNSIMIGGDFTSYSGVSLNNVTRLNTAGSIDSTFISESGFARLKTASLM